MRAERPRIATKMKFKEAVALLIECGIEDAKFDAAEIFIRLGGFNRSELLLSNPETDDEAILSAIKRRSKREPLQYILGEVYFYNERYRVTPDCLIPRSDTECLVEYAVKNIPRGECFIDLCTGSGCVGISTLANTKNTRAVLVDLSLPAVELARENAKRNGVIDKIRFECRDVLLPYEGEEIFAVLANPPYVTHIEYASLMPEIYFEPKMAFVADNNGLLFYERITEIYVNKIKKEGFIAYEIGKDQGNALRKIAERHSMDIEIIKDYSDNDRVAVLRHRI